MSNAETFKDLLETFEDEYGDTIAICDGSTDWHPRALITFLGESEEGIEELEGEYAYIRNKQKIKVYAERRRQRNLQECIFTVKIGSWNNQDNFNELVGLYSSKKPSKDECSCLSGCNNCLMVRN